MIFFINTVYIYMIIKNSLYYINYVCFYAIIIGLFKKNIIVMFKNLYKKYTINKKNNYISLNQENKHILSLKKTYKEKDRTILFFKKSIENFILIKNNQIIEDLENKKSIEIKIFEDEQNIRKNLYNNRILEYSKNAFKQILCNEFKNHTDYSFISMIIKNKK